MNAYIWQSIDQVSCNYHSGGGLVVFAATEERARELANATSDVQVQPEDKPDVIQPLGDGAEEKVLTFPDAGCC